MGRTETKMGTLRKEPTRTGGAWREVSERLKKPGTRHCERRRVEGWVKSSDTEPGNDQYGEWPTTQSRVFKGKNDRPPIRRMESKGTLFI